MNESSLAHSGVRHGSPRARLGIATSFLLGATALVGASNAQDAVRLTNTATSPGYVRIADTPVLKPQVFTIEAWFTPLGMGHGSVFSNFGATIIDKPLEGGIGPNLGSWAIRWSPVTKLMNVRVTSELRTTTAAT